MARASRSVHARKKRRKVLKHAKGYRGTKKSSYKRAKEQVWKSGVYAYVGGKQRKRDFRSLWIQRINAGVREHGLSYSKFIHGLRVAGMDLDRKARAALALTEPAAFAAVVSQAKNALDGEPAHRRTESDEVEATEAAERKAEELDVDLSEVEGTGSEGNILVEDVENTAGEVKATDAARRKAEELGVNLTTVEGTGANGRITVGDVENAAKEEDGEAG